MNIEEIWLANFKSVVTAEIASARNAAEGYRRVAARTGLGYDYIYQIYKGKPAHKPKRPSLDAMTSIGRAYGEGKPDHWFNVAPGEMVTPATQPSSGPATAQATITLGQALATLAHQLQSADDLGREQAGVLLKRLASEPERAAELAVRLAATLSSGQEGGASAASIDPITQPPGFLPKP